MCVFQQKGTSATPDISKITAKCIGSMSYLVSSRNAWFSEKNVKIYTTLHEQQWLTIMTTILSADHHDHHAIS